MIKVSDIRTDGGTQSRAAINGETVAEYADAMTNPDTVFPPAIVYYDGKDYWLADGFHRVAAWSQIGRKEVPAEVRQGGRREAILHSVAANSVHGLRRTNADKRRAVMTLMEDPEWSQWSNREIARRCAVSDAFVGKVRDELSANGLQIEGKRTVERNGKTYQQDTSNIGKSKPVQEDGATTKAQENKGEPAEFDHKEEIAPTADPYGYSKLTEDALLETANGLRADLDDEKAKRKAAEYEAQTLKFQIKELTADDDVGRKIGNLQRKLSQSEGRSKEHQANAARLQRQANAQAAEIKKLRQQIENQEITL